eukprot:CAMPEP_0198234830 /NCGR_PEP_ID=MMETSP1446-20131203/719_1 /TAXON_ID=1461542 ORGANISM="Unidentified sp, Strain CCMP2111" /NCGR_SAMPLE_ID=MMETSP1446 /ASSEMBLY_ACC=CAM_ASM_001112 /LENGTH=96 /DNA_ID=CAMNT_0043915653 /DNA_START=238 /DNA_END=528 /DNA_ORIENTATION=+
MAMTHFGNQVFSALQVPVPEFYRGIEEKKMVVSMGLFFVCNTIKQNLLSTGAFEVYYDGAPIFSKLEAHRMPTGDELVKSLEAAVKKREAQKKKHA